jgi:ribosomal protein S18 acetylase RimI-like enzyme
MEPIFFYRRAKIEDVTALVALRRAFLEEISGTKVSEPKIVESLAGYFSDGITSGQFVAFLTQAHSQVIASSGLVIHRHPPSVNNPTGREAYIMNMYTVPEYRRRGIATKLLDMLVDHARENGCGKVSLHAMEKGGAIYSRAGFEKIETEMRLRLR